MKLIEEKIAIIGLGYVGLPLAVEFGKVAETIGFDINLKRTEELIEGIDSTKELSKEQIDLSKKLTFTSDPESLRDCKTFIVTVPTPVDKSNQPDLSPLKKATELIANYLKKDNVVVYESTVFPGCTEEICVPILSEISGLEFNIEFFCGYSPERVNPGDKINTLTKIKKITSGSTEDIAKKIDALYLAIIDAGTYLAPSIKVAEAAKVIENTQRDLNIAFINELSKIFNLMDIDTIDVLNAAETKWNFQRYRPGMVGGHCIGVDPFYLTYKAEKLGYMPEIILAGRYLNEQMAPYAAEQTIKMMVDNEINLEKAVVGILGFAFKDNCPDFRNTKIIDLILEFKKAGIKTIVADSWVNKKDVKNNFDINLVEIDENFKVDALVVAVGHTNYKNFSINDLKNLYKVTSKKMIISDLKSIYDKTLLETNNFKVFRL
tara:strand:- start:11813 stop:13114 length:1302 start_codon:yes stop_codon:yes gene_type:complete